MWSEKAKTAYTKEAVRLINDLGKLGFQGFIMDGTLLGAARDKKIIPVDKDFDLGYLSKENNLRDVLFEFRTMVKPELEKKGYLVRSVSNKFRGKVREMLGQYYLEAKKGVYTNMTNVWFDFWLSWFDKDGHYTQILSIINEKEIEYKDIMPARLLELEGHLFPVPNNYKKVLARLYGNDWITPQKGVNPWNDHFSKRELMMIVDGGLIPKDLIEKIDMHELHYESLENALKIIDDVDIDSIYVQITSSNVDQVKSLIEKARKRYINVGLIGDIKKEIVEGLKEHNIFWVR